MRILNITLHLLDTAVLLTEEGYLSEQHAGLLQGKLAQT